MTTLAYFPIKRGDREPPFEAILRGPSGPVDLTGVSVVAVSYYRGPGTDPVLTKEAEVVNPSGQAVDHVDRGRIRHTWDDGDTETLFGPPDDPTVVLVHLEAEVEVLRAGLRTTWPTEGRIPVRVWDDLLEEGS